MDRRYYGRTRIGVMSNFIIKDNPLGLREFTGTIENISEGGILIRVDMDCFGVAVDSITEGMIIYFQTYDEYELFGQHKEDIITGEVEVIRVEQGEDVKLFGCKMKKLSPELNQYITNRKLSVYMKTIKE